MDARLRSARGTYNREDIALYLRANTNPVSIKHRYLMAGATEVFVPSRRKFQKGINAGYCIIIIGGLQKRKEHEVRRRIQVLTTELCTFQP